MDGIFSLASSFEYSSGEELAKKHLFTSRPVMCAIERGSDDVPQDELVRV